MIATTESIVTLYNNRSCYRLQNVLLSNVALKDYNVMMVFGMVFAHQVVSVNLKNKRKLKSRLINTNLRSLHLIV